MTVFRILFVIFLAIPFAALLFYFIVHMNSERRSARDEYDQIPAEPVRKREKVNSKRKPGTKKSGKKSGNASGTSRREAAETSENRRKQRPKQKPAPAPRTYYQPQREEAGPEYPSDPYASYRRPDFDSYVRNANARDRAAQESVYGTGSRGSGEGRRSGDGRTSGGRRSADETKRKRKTKRTKRKGGDRRSGRSGRTER